MGKYFIKTYGCHLGDLYHRLKTALTALYNAA
jgi:hypothetical protein